MDTSLNEGHEYSVNENELVFTNTDTETHDDETPLDPSDFNTLVTEQEENDIGLPVDEVVKGGIQTQEEFDVAIEKLDQLSNFKNKLLREKSISQEDAHELKQIDNTLSIKPINYFTENKTRTNFEETINTVDLHVSSLEDKLKTFAKGSVNNTSTPVDGELS